MRIPALALLAPLIAATHPLHTTHTALADTGNGRVEIVIRAFTDDLRSSVMKHERASDDSATARYARATLVLVGRDGRPAVLHWRGAAREGDITLLRLTADCPAGLAGAEVRQTMHAEMFDDQVNVVEADYGGRRVHLLFLPGDDPKRLP